MDGLHLTTVQQKESIIPILESIIPILKEETGIDDTPKSPRTLMTNSEYLLWRKGIEDPDRGSWLQNQFWKTKNQE